MPHTARFTESFARFNEGGGKFRVAITDRCNLDCFFCHNEGMANPRRPAASALRLLPPGPTLGADDLVAIIDAFARLGGRQVNITGGEPLARPDAVALLARIDKRDTRVVLNTNAILAPRLLAHPKLATVDAIFASLHTTDDGVFRDTLGGRAGTAAKVMRNIAALADHGYEVQINYSLHEQNRDGFAEVLDFAVAHGIALKAIAVIRVNDADGFYGGDWIDPRWIGAALAARGARGVGAADSFGGHTTTYEVGGTRVKVKNVARGRLRTDFCNGCAHESRCGEGIYGLRVGVDGVWKPCLLRHEAYTAVRRDVPYEAQILGVIDAMVGEWPAARYVAGAPQ